MACASFWGKLNYSIEVHRMAVILESCATCHTKSYLMHWPWRWLAAYEQSNVFFLFNVQSCCFRSVLSYSKNHFDNGISESEYLREAQNLKMDLLEQLCDYPAYETVCLQSSITFVTIFAWRWFSPINNCLVNGA